VLLANPNIRRTIPREEWERFSRQNMRDVLLLVDEAFSNTWRRGYPNRSNITRGRGF